MRVGPRAPPVHVADGWRTDLILLLAGHEEILL